MLLEPDELQQPIPDWIVGGAMVVLAAAGLTCFALALGSWLVADDAD